MKSPLMIAATAAALLSGTALMSGTAAAETSTPSEFRGYQACLAANEDAFRGLVPERQYLISRTDEKSTYYINATAWENGERVDVAFSCETTPNGQLISAQVTADTRYAAASDAMQVAGQ
jgi:hypothetical protein